jgi:PHS family inorganic phosphate transporter-like MFS transporter
MSSTATKYELVAPPLSPPSKRPLAAWVTGLSNYSVQYNFQAISIALLVMSDTVCTSTPANCSNGVQAAWVGPTAAGTVFAGAVAGQLTLGWLGDRMGRDPAMLLTLSVAACAAVCSAALPPFSGPATSVYTTIIVSRFILGVGLGGVYPLSAAKAAESASATATVDVGAKKAAQAFFWQTPGALSPWLVAYVLLYVWPSLSADTMWRLLLGTGAVPAAAVAGLSLLEMRAQPSTSRDRPVVPSAVPAPPPRPAAVMWFQLVYAGGTWLLFDVVYYSVGLYGGQILTTIGPQRALGDSVSSAASIRSTSLRQALALSLGIPSVALTIALLKPLRTKRTQTLGFAFVTVCFVLIAAVFESSRTDHPLALFSLYCLLLFSMAGGPNVTTFILPAETFPKDVRTTYNGVCAACGKVGAVIGVFGFGPLSRVTSFPVVMSLCAAISAAAMALTHFCVPDEAGDGDFPPPASCDLCDIDAAPGAALARRLTPSDPFPPAATKEEGGGGGDVVYDEETF